MENKAKDTVTGNAMAIGSSYFAEHISGSKTTSQKEIDHILGELQAHKEKWIKLEIAQRIRFLDEMQNGFLNIKQRWVKAELKGKNIAPQSIGEAEEWGTLATVFRAVRKLKQSLLEIQQYGKELVKLLQETRLLAEQIKDTVSEAKQAQSDYTLSVNNTRDVIYELAMASFILSLSEEDIIPAAQADQMILQSIETIEGRSERFGKLANSIIEYRRSKRQ